MDLTVITKSKNSTTLLIQYLLDTIFPKICVQCETEGTYLCRVCLDGIKKINSIGICLLCKNTLTNKDLKFFGSNCTTCKRWTNIDGLLIPYEYTSPAIEKCIRALKYRGVRDIADILGSAWCTFFESIPYIMLHRDFLNNKDIELIPMPLHRSTKLSRGFNQAELLAEAIGKEMKWTINNTIARRIKRTSTQTKLLRPERLYNMQGAFEIQGAVQNKTYIIVDDVITSGTSIASLAKELKIKGAKRVWAAAIAHG